jgi:small-conductance mechanosensitive channel
MRSYLVRRFLREIMGLIVFYFVARTVGRAVLSPEDLMFAAPFATYLILFPRVGAALSRFILAPNRSNLRLVNVDDHWAAYLHRNIIGLILLGGLTIFVVGFNARNGIAPGETRIGFWLDTAVYIYIAIIAWTAREGLVNMMRGTDPDRTPFDEKVAQAYPYFAIALAAVMFVIVSTMMGLGELAPLLKGAHYTTLFWLLMAPALDTGIRGLVRHLVPPMKGGGPVAEAAYKSTKRSYIKIGRVIVMGIIVVLLANSWNIQLFAAGDRAGIGDNIFGFAMTLVVGYVIYELVGLYINRRLAAEQTSREVTADEAGGEGGGGSGSRLGTVLPLLRVTAQIAIMVVFGLLAIGNLGIDITPLLAGAGILGLAIGFGAQKLVSDVVSGIFFLVDDAFRVGEYVEIGATRGAVEKISIRSMQLRHHRGAVHTIPYGEIPQLTNYSRDWVIMKLRFTVPFDTDPNKIKKIFKKIGAEMKDDPMFAEDFIEPFKSQGVFEFDDVGMVVRGKYMAKPGKQFTIRKEIYNRVKQEFDEAGIDFARREVRVAMPEHEDDHLSSAEETAIKAAAVEAVQQSIRDQEKPA